ncbi:hypothetical protein GCM10027270_26820 [Nocardioides ginkgobilobae]
MPPNPRVGVVDRGADAGSGGREDLGTNVAVIGHCHQPDRHPGRDREQALADALAHVSRALGPRPPSGDRAARPKPCRSWSDRRSWTHVRGEQAVPACVGADRHVRRARRDRRLARGSDRGRRGDGGRPLRYDAGGPSRLDGVAVADPGAVRDRSDVPRDGAHRHPVQRPRPHLRP